MNLWDRLLGDLKDFPLHSKARNKNNILSLSIFRYLFQKITWYSKLLYLKIIMLSFRLCLFLLLFLFKFRQVIALFVDVTDIHKSDCSLRALSKPEALFQDDLKTSDIHSGNSSIIDWQRKCVNIWWG
jgi:hypothetical protein